MGHLEEISASVGEISLYILLPFILLHTLLVTLQAVAMVPAFRAASMSEKAVQIAASTFMVVPFRTGQNADREAEKRQEGFQLVLHLVGNMVLMYTSKVFFFNGLPMLSFPLVWLDVCFILPVVTSNLLAGAVFLLYHSRLELWAFLASPQTANSVRPDTHSTVAH